MSIRCRKCWYFGRNDPLSAEIDPFGRKSIFQPIFAFGRNCSPKIQFFRFRPKLFRLICKKKFFRWAWAAQRPAAWAPASSGSSSSPQGAYFVLTAYLLLTYCLLTPNYLAHSYEGLVETVPGVNLSVLRMDNYEIDKSKDTLFRWVKFDRVSN